MQKFLGTLRNQKPLLYGNRKNEWCGKLIQDPQNMMK
jgi:hypothetical protein